VTEVAREGVLKGEGGVQADVFFALQRMVVQQLASLTSTVESVFCKMIAARGFVALERGVGEEDRTGGSDTEEMSASGTYFRRIYVPVGGKSLTTPISR
jgi:hypothetical protein